MARNQVWKIRPWECFSSEEVGRTEGGLNTGLGDKGPVAYRVRSLGS